MARGDSDPGSLTPDREETRGVGGRMTAADVEALVRDGRGA
jgi:hypothetical protein